ncbi:MAG: chemotaxis protein CheA [Nitrospiraceae bacterium]|nr:chemotaxis protein CheA [Nitrospiraceae bacterium]
MADEMEEIVADFISEAEESLERIDPLFVELEAKGHDKDILHDIFRSMHTIKGAAGFLGFQLIVDVAHKAESIMKKLRDDETSISTALIDVILRSVDMLKLLIRHLKMKDGAEEDIRGLLGDLDAALSGEVATPTGTDDSEGEKPSVIGAEEETGYDGGAVPGALPVQEVPREATAAQTADKGSASPAKETSPTLRIDVERVDKVMDLTGEIVLVRNRLLNIANEFDVRYSGDDAVESLASTVSFLDLVTADMQLAVMKMRMQPLKKVFSKFPRLVRDMSNGLGKEIELKISGEGTEVDRTVIEQIGDPMVHILRNSIDHGIEPAEARLQKGKPAKGAISIDASQQGNHIVIEVSDNGKGIDLGRVKQKALEKGLVSQEEFHRMTDESAVNLIFLPGFSTAEVATQLSGRGVGMDVVKTNIAKLNGFVEVMTEKDKGTRFRISIPLTLAIIQALMVRAGGRQYAIPLAPIEETLKICAAEIKEITGQGVIEVRDSILPLFELADVLGCTARPGVDARYVLIIAIGDKKFGIAVDELLGQEEVVIKNVGGIDVNSSYIVGATITGEGKVVLILDLAGISRNAIGLIKV